MRRALAAALLLALAPTPLFAAVTAQTWSGTWFGSGQPDDRSEMYIDYFEPGGVFRNHHRYCRRGQAEDFMGTGRWTIDGDILTIVLAAPAQTDRYRIFSVDATTQRYAVLPSNFGYTARKVAADFEMPRCDLAS